MFAHWPKVIADAPDARQEYRQQPQCWNSTSCGAVFDKHRAALATDSFNRLYFDDNPWLRFWARDGGGLGQKKKAINCAARCAAVVLYARAQGLNAAPCPVLMAGKAAISGSASII